LSDPRAGDRDLELTGVLERSETGHDLFLLAGAK
jgi:hypothetical protein